MFQLNTKGHKAVKQFILDHYHPYNIYGTITKTITNEWLRDSHINLDGSFHFTLSDDVTISGQREYFFGDKYLVKTI